MAEATNALRILTWQPTKDGQAGRRPPEMIRPPWVEDENKETKHFGSDPVPLDDLADFLGWEAELAT